MRDANEAAVQNATVTLKNVATEIAQTTTTDANGDYQLVNVKIGIYQVIVEANGFSRTVADNINVTVNARQRVDLTLQVATATETVVVTDAANPLQTDSSEIGQVVQRNQIGRAALERSFLCESCAARAGRARVAHEQFNRRRRTRGRF